MPSGAGLFVLACRGVVVLAHMWARDSYVLCRRMERFTLLKTALSGKDTTLVGEFAMVPLPSM